MEALIALLGPALSWIGWAAAIMVALFAAYVKGKSTGASNERQERETAVLKQQVEDLETVREINHEVGKMDDVTLRERAANWVRDK